MKKDKEYKKFIKSIKKLGEIKIKMEQKWNKEWYEDHKEEIRKLEMK